MSERKPDGYWKSLENVVAEVEKVKRKHGFEGLPCAKKLDELGYSSLEVAVVRYHGGFRRFRELLGEQKKDWKSLENVIVEAERVKKKYGWDELPGACLLRKHGSQSLVNGIKRYHGGFRRFRELLGEEQKKRGDGAWKSREYAVQQAREVMEKEGWRELPSDYTLRKKGYTYLITGINIHGGFHKFREILGEEQKMRKRDTWKSLEYTIQQAREVMEKHGFESLSGFRTLMKIGYSSLSYAIGRYHGGFPAFRKFLGGHLKRRENHLWESCEYTISQAQEVMNKYGLKKLPSADKLQELGYSSLGFAISTYHGGFITFRRLLNKELGIKSEKEQLEGLLERYVRE